MIQDSKRKIVSLITKLQNSSEVESSLKLATKDSDQEVADFAKNLITIRKATGPDEFPYLLETLMEEIKNYSDYNDYAPDGYQTATGYAEDTCATESSIKSDNPEKPFDFEKELANTVEATCALWNQMQGKKSYGYGVNMSDFRVALNYSRGQSYGLSITLNADKKKAILRQLGKSPQDLITKCDRFLANMVSGLNKTDKKVAN